MRTNQTIRRFFAILITVSLFLTCMPIAKRAIADNEQPTNEQPTIYYIFEKENDDMLYECPKGCERTRLELVLRQFRHISFHTGMLNGQTALATGKFPMWVSQADKYVDDGVLFGRYRKGQITK